MYYKGYKIIDNELITVYYKGNLLKTFGKNKFADVKAYIDLISQYDIVDIEEDESLYCSCGAFCCCDDPILFG